MTDPTLGDFEEELFRQLGIALSQTTAGRLEEKFFYDPRWKLLNSAALRELLPWMHHRAQKEGKHFRLYYIDLHDLHKTNRQYGDTGGDCLLAAMAEVLREYYPPGDYPLISAILDHRMTPNVTLATGRWGGDEFLALALADDKEALDQFGERLRSTVTGKKARMPDGSEAALSTSLGQSDHTSGKTWQMMLEEANRASDREKKERGLGREAGV